MKNKILWIFSIIPLFVTVFFIRFMPDKIPAHYDIEGNINRWGSKYESFIFPIIIIFMAVFWSMFLNFFRKKQKSSTDEKTIAEAKLKEKVIYYVAVGVSIMFSIMHDSIMYSAFVETKNIMQVMAIDLNIITNVTTGIFLIIIGNIIPKSKLNSVSGIRTTWSMKNDITWAKSNRFGGICFIMAGFIISIEALLIGGILSTVIMLGILILSAVISIVYSYYAYKKYG